MPHAKYVHSYLKLPPLIDHVNSISDLISHPPGHKHPLQPQYLEPDSTKITSQSTSIKPSLAQNSYIHKYSTHSLSRNNFLRQPQLHMLCTHTQN
jgi:hypothetical protein